MVLINKQKTNIVDYGSSDMNTCKSLLRIMIPYSYESHARLVQGIKKN